jgi:ubiquinol-cytochrome c reductase cytochrome c subunit
MRMGMCFVRGSPAPALAALVAIAAIVAGASDSARAGADAQKGNAAFVSHGCWECHGFNGQGGEASNGKVIARTPLPLDAFVAFVRNTNGEMPPFKEAIISDAELADIYTYLQSLPQPKAVSDIPLLNGGRSQ